MKQTLKEIYSELGNGYGFNGSDELAIRLIKKRIVPLLNQALEIGFLAGRSKQKWATLKKEYAKTYLS